MGDLESIGYYFWLIPSIISCTFSTLLLVIRLYSYQKIRWIGFFELLFAIADIIQCIPWFFGSIYHTNDDSIPHHICATQEGMFSVGLLVKCMLSTIGIAPFSISSIRRKPIEALQVLKYASVLIVYTIITLIMNFILNGVDVACQNIHNVNGANLEDFELAYMLCFVLPMCIFCTINFTFLVLTMRAAFMNSKESTMVSALMTPQYDRVIMFAFVTWIGYFPSFVFYTFFLFSRVNILSYCLTGLMVSSTGTLGSGYLIFSPWIDKARKTNLFFFIEKLVEENESMSEMSTVEGVKLSEISSFRS